MIKTIIIPFLAIFTIGNILGQDRITRSEFIDFQSGVGVEAFYQSNYGFGIGGLITKNVGHKIKPNYSAGIYADAILVNTPIYGPRVKLNYNYLGIFGVNLNFSNYYRTGLNDFRITPEINFSIFGVANIFAGYSFKISKSNFSELNEFRLGMNLSLVHFKK
ncbi:MAG: hypothetical protein RL264_466 [Bacteroidota bacterium]|jgi:hypothetical protein